MEFAGFKGCKLRAENWQACSIRSRVVVKGRDSAVMQDHVVCDHVLHNTAKCDSADQKRKSAPIPRDTQISESAFIDEDNSLGMNLKT